MLHQLRVNSEPYPSTKPQFLFYEMNKRCNLRCNHCDFWKRNDKNKESYYQSAELEELFSSFAELCGHSLVICGGEPMLDFERYLTVCSLGRKAGLRVLSVVNGTAPALFRRGGLESLLAYGPHELSVSFDDFRENEHNLFRGVKHGFKLSKAFLENLLSDRKGGVIERVNIMGLIHGGNYLELRRFYEFALIEMGVDKLKLNFIQPSFGGSNGELDIFFERYSGINTDALMRELDYCSREYGVEYSPSWLGSVRVYFDSLAQGRENRDDFARGWDSELRTSAQLCNSHERNIMVTADGYASLCFSAAFEGKKLKKPGEIKEFWVGASETRHQMDACRRLCGISHSVRKASCHA